MKFKSSAYTVEVSANPIDVLELLRSVSDSGSGSTLLFMGTVRDQGRVGRVKEMNYEAYESMAVKEIGEIVQEAFQKWQLCRVTVAHRTGRLHLKQPSVAVAVSSPHRNEGFLACKFIIDSIKTKAPIWKKEILTDGREMWVE